jgi:Ca2+-binding RTX toxin-like protein
MKLSGRGHAALTALVISAAALMLPAAAMGASATIANGVLTYTAAPGETNKLKLQTGPQYTIEDTGAQVTPASGCSVSDPGRHNMTCPLGLFSSIVVDAGDMNDTVTDGLLVTPVTMLGGSGDDKLTGGWANDTLDGGPGADVLKGGGGTDTVTYASRSAAVNVSLDGVANDGEAGEGDNAGTDV